MDSERDRKEEELRWDAGRGGPIDSSVGAEGRAEGLRVEAGRVGSGTSRVDRRYLRHRRTPRPHRGRNNSPNRAPYHPPTDLPHRRLRGREDGLPLGAQARSAGCAVGVGGHAGVGDHKRGLLGVSSIDQLSAVTLPQGAQQSAQQAPPEQGLDTILSVSGILALLFPFIGGALGGLWGARTGSRRP